ncbi:MAG: omptin family outer membrane protease [Thermodesulfobacteriota bacterium]|nr:omptin family outer membrane protease [Thermodesulfobacteriota bacterium]
MADSEAISSRVELRLEQLTGMTQYQIGGLVVLPTQTLSVNFPLSELEFPLYSYLGSITLHTTLWDRLALSLTGKANMTHSDPGTMKDSDWINNTAYPDVYSESDANLNVRIWSMKLAYRFLKHDPYALYAGIGYIHQNFGFDISNTNQFSNIPEYSSGYYPGPTLTYDITYTIPYVELGAAFQANDRVSMSFNVGYSPYADAEDEDQHLLRNRIARGDCDGYAILGDINSRYAFADQWAVNIQADYCYISTDGISKTYDTAGNWQNTIDQETESKQASIGIAIEFEF